MFIANSGRLESSLWRLRLGVSVVSSVRESIAPPRVIELWFQLGPSTQKAHALYGYPESQIVNGDVYICGTSSQVWIVAQMTKTPKADGTLLTVGTSI